ncbi:hypothetical protein EHS25_009502 [Saitozyma podzolica]|uniref:TEL2-interacting protein 1 n=1 Tax=Saitozyma podzolica TaxID=1890683 RepID=A0A427YJF9_9TREE|nr:hypothetical protein EHS25_009502 [Saitozyma podzolica]
MAPIRIDDASPPSRRTVPAMNGGPPRAAATANDPASRARMEAFRRVKPTCVSLLALVSSPPTPNSQHALLLASLQQTLSTLAPEAYSEGMINYLLFPLTQILRSSDPSALPDNFLEAAFSVLATVVRAWRSLPNGMDVRAWEQLWRFVVAAVGPRLGGKGKGKAIGQEVQYEAVDLLASLLEPGSNGSHPTAPMRLMWSSSKAPLMPTLFQSITILLSTTSPHPAHRPLQRSSLSLLSHLIGYLQGQHSVLASVLPGVISGISKLLADEGKSVKGDVAKLAAEVVKEVIVLTLGDDDLRSLGVLRPQVDDLSQLAEEIRLDREPLTTSEPPPPSPAPSTASTSSKLDPFPPLSQSYLAFTSTQLLSAIPPILTLLSSHPSDTARTAAASLSEALIVQSPESLPLLIPHALRALLLLSQDPFDPVRHDARRKLRVILSTSLELDTALIDLLNNSMNALPRFIQSQQDVKVDELARLITALAEATDATPRNPIAELLGPGGKVERWSWSLLDCLEFGRPSGWSSQPHASKTAELGWGSGLGTGILPMIEGEGPDGLSPPEQAFPNLPLRHVESASTTRSLTSTLVALGTAGGPAALHSVDFFLQFSKTHRSRDPAKAVSALWVAERLLEGVADAQERVEGRVSKAVRKMAREAARIVVAMDEDEDEDYDEPYDAKEESDAVVPIQRGGGLNELTTLLDRPMAANSSASSTTRRLHAQAQRTLLTCSGLSLLSLTSRILSSSFRPLLLNALYDVLSHLASPVVLVRDFANIALAQIAYHTGYASPQNLILDNIDYVINVVSLRLTRARLSHQAPLVLIAMIRLVGGEIVPMVHDVVDEIFDALDDYHGYEALASGLLAVLVTLIDAMKAEVDAEGPSEARLQKISEMRRIDPAPNPESDFTRFTGWWDERAKRRRRDVDEILERAPQHAWGKPKGEGADEPEPEPPQEEETPPTRTQEVAAQILDKSTHFITHGSPFLRARILDLIASAVPVLAAGNRESDLLPLIDRAWPSILNRLDDTSPHVVTSSAEVIASLAEHVGDFMSKRILEHAWPRFKRMLDAQRLADTRSALSRRGPGAIGTESSYTSSHRLHVAILRCARWVVEEVPVNEELLWDMMLVFRPFLDKRAHEELQRLGRVVYEKLASRDADALWVVIKATMGELQGDHGVYGYLRESALDIEANAEVVLAGL